MRNEGCSGGCLSFIAGIVLIGLVLLAVKWFGIPAGIGLGILGFVQFKKFDSAPEAFERTARSLGMQPIHLRWASIAAMVVGAILVIASVIIWTVPTDDAQGSGSATNAGLPPEERTYPGVDANHYTLSAEGKARDLCERAMGVSSSTPFVSTSGSATHTGNNQWDTYVRLSSSNGSIAGPSAHCLVDLNTLTVTSIR